MWTSINIPKKLVYRLIVRAVPLLLLAGTGSGQVSTPALADVGLLPTPTLQDVQVNAEVSFDVGTQLYTYAHTVGNPATNTGDIWNIRIDITDPFAGSRFFDTAGLTIPHGGNFFPFDEELAELQPLLDVPPGTILIPVGQRVPSGWNGGLDKDGLAGFHSSGPSVEILPGQVLTGFELISPGLPAIRKVQVHPFWAFLVDNIEAVTPEEEMAAREIEQAIIFHTFTLGPSGLTAGTFAHWDRLQDDLDQAIQLGWIPDATLANTLVTQLASAREALDNSDGTLAKTRLQTLIQTVTQSTPAQRRSEVEGLVRLNAEKLIENTPDTPIPFEPKASLTPESTTLPLGAQYTLTATVVNLGDPANPPVPNFELGFEVVEGPNEGLGSRESTDAQGQVRFSYTGTQLGTDKIVVGVPLELPAFYRSPRPQPDTHRILVRLVGKWDPIQRSERLRKDKDKMLANLDGELEKELGSAEVTWSGGPDLVVPLFIPPILKSEGGNTVMVEDWTENIGTIPAPASTTRYFLSVEGAVDPATAQVIGERTVPALNPGERSESTTQSFTVPSDLPEDVYQLAACADAPGSVVELEEENNCSFSQLQTSVSIVLPLEEAPAVATFLVIDADSIDDGTAGLGRRAQLSSFAANVGGTISLQTGEVGDEGWFALKTIPTSWAAAGPTEDGLRNYLGNPSEPFPHNVGPGLGTGADPEALLDEIPDVTPLRATGLKMLEEQQVCAVVYGSDISINYDPLQGSLKGDTQGTVAFQVISVRQSTDASSSLPEVELQILDADEICGGTQTPFTEAPAPISSSEPFDVVP